MPRSTSRVFILYPSRKEVQIGQDRRSRWEEVCSIGAAAATTEGDRNASARRDQEGREQVRDSPETAQDRLGAELHDRCASVAALCMRVAHFGERLALIHASTSGTRRTTRLCRVRRRPVERRGRQGAHRLPRGAPRFLCQTDPRIVRLFSLSLSSRCASPSNLLIPLPHATRLSGFLLSQSPHAVETRQAHPEHARDGDRGRPFGGMRRFARDGRTGMGRKSRRRCVLFISLLARSFQDGARVDEHGSSRS